MKKLDLLHEHVCKEKSFNTPFDNLRSEIQAFNRRGKGVSIYMMQEDPYVICGVNVGSLGTQDTYKTKNLLKEIEEAIKMCEYFNKFKVKPGR